MHFSVLPILALASTFTGVFSAPAPEAGALEARGLHASIVTNLRTAIHAPLAAINSTAASIKSGALTQAAGQVLINGNTTIIVNAIQAVTTSLDKRDLQTRQTTNLGVLVGTLLADVIAVVDTLLFDFGLGPASGLLTALEPALSNLILALDVTVVQLLAAVSILVNNLLTGIAAGLLVR